MRRIDAAEDTAVTLTLNGHPARGRAEPRTHLADFLRHALGATGTHVGCEHGVCGACTVLLDGVPARACMVYAVQAQGRRVDTVEGLEADDGTLGALQDAFTVHGALQCGFCTAGILMSATAFLREHPQPTEAEVRSMLSGHLCRCTGYRSIVDAILDAAGTLPRLQTAPTPATVRT